MTVVASPPKRREARPVGAAAREEAVIRNASEASAVGSGMLTQQELEHRRKVARSVERWEQRVREFKAWREGRSHRPWWLRL
jgi:hypothetical protein